MKTFQVIFQTGRVQNLMADSWSNESGIVRFKVGGSDSVTFPAHELIMIDQPDELEGYMPRRNRQRAKAATA
jgi:hypothetical protein